MIAEIAYEYGNLWADWGETPEPIAHVWVVEQGIFNKPVDWDKPITYNELAWALYKARGKA
jgi:hypothetical protein